jgi:hypothetical protein
MTDDSTPASLATAFIEMKRDRALFVTIKANAIKQIAFFSSSQRVKRV